MLWVIVFWVVVFVLSLFVLLKAADFFTNAAEKIGISLGIPPFIVGVTIVSIGTSLPELISSIFAVINGASEMVTANVFGSNIANVFLVLGIAAIVGKKLPIGYELKHVDLPYLVGSSLLLVFFCWDGVFNFYEGIVSLFLLVVYIIYTINVEKKSSSDDSLKKKVEKSVKEDVAKGLRRQKIKKRLINIIILGVSAIFIYFGAKYTVESVIRISDLTNFSKEIISASAIAFGTSLPELVVSVKAAMKGNAGIAVGNVLGSNIFNAFAVMGIPSFISSLTISDKMINLGIPFVVFSAVLYFFATQDKRITRWEGWLLVVFYVVFIAKMFNMF